ncbi:hypothetical protein E6R62_36310 [Streptomyces sp. A1136]|nr:hypothetical protein E6R62_36310 [Streptomyces sp. A1136]
MPRLVYAGSAQVMSGALALLLVAAAFPDRGIRAAWFGATTRVGPGRPRVRPDRGVGDKGYSSKAIRTWLRRRGVRHTIPDRSDQVRNRIRRSPRGGRPPAFDKRVYKCRNVVERCFNRLKQWLGIATRYDKTAHFYQAAVTLASLLMWA